MPTHPTVKWWFTNKKGCEIALNELLTPEKAQTIRETITQIEYTGALSPIKEKLGDGFTYGEIRAMLVEMGWLEPLN